MTTPFKMEYDRRVADGRILLDPGHAEAVAVLDRLSAALLDHKPATSLFDGFRKHAEIRGAYLWGKVGRGKSMLMNLFYDQAGERMKRRLHFHAFMAEVHASMHALQTESQQGSAGQDSIAAAADAFAHSAHLLCLDELEVTDIADAMIVGRLFDRLFDRGVVLVTTSNEPPDGLYSNGPNRELFVPFVERLKQHTFVVKLSGEHDYRSDGTEELSAYLCPFTPQNTVRFDRLWQKKLAHHPEKSAAVSVHGHKLKLERTSGQALRVTFDDVCKRALSADDHLALAHRFVSVFLEDVPIIEGEHTDEGRRLVTLVDALYEAKAHLVILAAAEPDEIFEDTASDDHQRTISRLKEMRNAAWLKQANRP